MEMFNYAWWWLFTEDPWFVPSMIATVIVVYFGLKTYLPEWAKADRYYLTTVDEEKKEIKVISLAGKVEGFLGPDYNYKSGKFEKDKKTDYRSFFLYRHFGVTWVGYGCKVTKIIPIWNDVQYRVKETETAGMPTVSFTVRLNTMTDDAYCSMGYSSLEKTMEEDTIELCNNLVKTYEIADVVKADLVFNINKGGDEEKLTWKTATKIKELLVHKDGQKLLLLALEDFEICDENVKKALESKDIQENRNVQQKLEAEGHAIVAEIKAKEEAAIELVKANADLAAKEIEDKKNRIDNATDLEKLAKEAKILGQDGAVKLEESRALAGAIKGHPGLQYLSFGKDTPSVLLNGEGKKKK